MSNQPIILAGAITFMDAPLDQYEPTNCTGCDEVIHLGPRQREVKAKAESEGTEVEQLCLRCIIVLQAETGIGLNVQTPDLP